MEKKSDSNRVVYCIHWILYSISFTAWIYSNRYRIHELLWNVCHANFCALCQTLLCFGHPVAWFIVAFSRASPPIKSICLACLTHWQSLPFIIFITGIFGVCARARPVLRLSFCRRFVEHSHTVPCTACVYVLFVYSDYHLNHFLSMAWPRVGASVRVCECAWMCGVFPMCVTLQIIPIHMRPP